QRVLSLYKIEAARTKNDIFGFDAWLNAISSRDPVLALDVAEIYFEYIRSTKSYLYNHDNNLTQMLTRIFEQAEEIEESDGGAMLQRVVSVQDVLLALGVNGMIDWLKAAER
ncbi:MAG TPA: hypothetical protein VF433_09950, partial [Cellvibrio sp.]